MLYFTLPNAFINYDIINYFKYILEVSPEFFQEKESISFNYGEGNSPFCYWNGGQNNNNTGNVYSYNKIINLVSKMGVPLRFNCSNINLEETDYLNVLGNLILQLGENGSNVIEITNLNFMRYLKEKYPNYNFIFSKESFLLQELTPELINKINKYDNFLFISLPEYLNENFDFLNQIENKNKIELSVNPICDCSCKNYFNCHLNAHQTQYDFSKKNIFELCDYNLGFQYESHKNLNVKIIKEKYSSIGINHFYINDYFYNKVDLAMFLIKFFIKDEYQLKVFYNMEKEQILND